MHQSRRLTEIIQGHAHEELTRAWRDTEAAGDFEPLPAGVYVAHVVRGELFTAGTGTPGFKITFRVAEGEYEGRHVWHDVWLTPAAMAMAKRDLGKLGITELDQLEAPLPQGIRCEVKVALRRDEDGNQRNHVRSFQVLGIDEPEADPFAPKPAPDGEASPEPPDEHNATDESDDTPEDSTDEGSEA